MRILLVSALRDEGPHLLEWVAHHRALGVTDFLLFSNDCSDGTDAMLDALSPAGVVHVRNVPPKGKSIQWHALKQAWAHDLRKAADWILCIDSDEFINLRPPLAGLAGLIEHCGDADAIILPWRLFGNDGQAFADDALTTQTFTRAMPEGCNYPVVARQFKTLFKSKGPFRQIGVHRPRLKKDTRARWVDGSGAPMPDGFDLEEQRLTLFGLPAASALVQLNHYSVRSAQSFMLKQRRGLPNRKGKALDMTYWIERNFNTVEDRTIEGMLPATFAQLDRLRNLPGLQDLHNAAVAHHSDLFEEIMRDTENVKFFGRLLLAASSVPLKQPLIEQLAYRYRAAHG